MRLGIQDEELLNRHFQRRWLMRYSVAKSDIKGTIDIPGSKSHTIRALFFASLAKGKSRIRKPLISEDALSALKACRTFGAGIEDTADGYLIGGMDGKPSIPYDIIDVGNSGTTLRIALSTAALIDGYSLFTGDEQIRSRPIGPVLSALNNLGATAISTLNNGRAPAVIKGMARGGDTELDGISSQFLSSLLINCPLMENNTEIRLTRLNEAPYVDITLWWLKKLGIKFENHSYNKFYIKGGQSFPHFDMAIPADFSSATFFIVLAAVSGGTVTIGNLDISDPQGDKMVLDIIGQMGAEVTKDENGITIRGRGLKGIEIDMNSIPDALPALAVAGCFAEGETRLLNVPQARLKETDRIKVMHDELARMGADISELEDGLVVRRSNLKPTVVDGHADHRIVMALATAGLNLDGTTVIEKAEAAAVTFPTFPELIKSCGGNITVE